jgi:hypothetical protein
MIIHIKKIVEDGISVCTRLVVVRILISINLNQIKTWILHIVSDCELYVRGNYDLYNLIYERFLSKRPNNLQKIKGE